VEDEALCGYNTHQLSEELRMPDRDSLIPSIPAAGTTGEVRIQWTPDGIDVAHMVAGVV